MPHTENENDTVDIIESDGSDNDVCADSDDEDSVNKELLLLSQSS